MATVEYIWQLTSAELMAMREEAHAFANSDMEEVRRLSAKVKRAKKRFQSTAAEAEIARLNREHFEEYRRRYPALWGWDGKFHKIHVSRAVQAGLPVPDRVLEEYPDIRDGTYRVPENIPWLIGRG